MTKVQLSQVEELEWAIRGISQAIKEAESGIANWDLRALKSKLEILEHRLNRARSFTDPLGIED